jgi:hypothetical protein
MLENEGLLDVQSRNDEEGGRSNKPATTIHSMKTRTTEAPHGELRRVLRAHRNGFLSFLKKHDCSIDTAQEII